jgi:hypothetical protein
MVNLAALYQSPDEKAKRGTRVSEFAKAIEQSDPRIAPPCSCGWGPPLPPTPRRSGL